MQTSGTCPSPSVLEAFATGACADEWVSSHLDACDVCRAVVDAARENNQFLAGVRRLLATPGSALDTDASLEPELVHGYEIREEIHRGGQGVVYRAIQTRTRRIVAIKVLLGWKNATGRQRERFEREIRIAAGLRHPNIVTVHDSRPIGDGRYGLVMEHIEGGTLDRWSHSLEAGPGREGRRMALRARLRVMSKVCDAVFCAHQHSIVHRDLKPGNILVDAAGEPHVLDFGIARDVGPGHHPRLTETGEFAGTLAYASPEQVSGDPSRMDTRSDVYSLGVILYELVSGRMPYAVDGPIAQSLRNIEVAEPTPLLRPTRDPQAPWMDGDLATIVLKALAKDPARRYQTAAALRDDIDRYLAGEAIEARRDSTWYLLRKVAARHRVAVVAASLAFVTLATLAGAMAWQASRLAIRGRQLAAALSASSVDRGRALAIAGEIQQAEGVVWPELIRAGITQIDGSEAGFAGAPDAVHAYWALWDIYRRASCLMTYRTHRKQVESLYFDQGDTRLNGFDWTGRLFSWSVAAGPGGDEWLPLRELNLVPPIEGVVLRAAVAPGGTIAVFGGGFVRVVDPETGRIEAQADDPENVCATGAFSPDGRLLATIGQDHRLRLQDARSLEVITTVREEVAAALGGDVCMPTFSPDGAQVAAGMLGGAVGIWDVTTGRLERTLQPPEALVARHRGRAVANRIAFGASGTVAASFGAISASAYFHVLVWSADGSSPRDLGWPGGSIVTLAFVPGTEGRTLLSSGGSIGNGGGLTIVWEMATGDRVQEFRQATIATACAASADGRLLAMGDDDPCTVRVYEVASDPHVTVLQPAVWRVSTVAMSRDGRLVALTAPPPSPPGWDIVVLDVRTKRPMQRIHTVRSPPASLEFAPDGGSIFAGEVGGIVVQRDLTSGSIVREFTYPEPLDRPARAPFNIMRLSPQGTMLAQARSDDGRIGLWDVSSGEWLGWLDSGSVEPPVIDFSPDGTALVAHTTREFVIWDVQSRTPRNTLAAATYLAPAVRASPDGTTVARVVDGCVQFCDAGTGSVLRADTVFATDGRAMAFHPAGPILFTSGLDASIRLWDSRTGRELLALRKHTAPVIALAISPDGGTLVSSDTSGVVLAWDLNHYNGTIRRELEHHVAHDAAP